MANETIYYPQKHFALDHLLVHPLLSNCNESSSRTRRLAIFRRASRESISLSETSAIRSLKASRAANPNVKYSGGLLFAALCNAPFIMTFPYARLLHENP